MYFAATDNLALVGYDYRIVGFDSRKKRDVFVKNEKEYSAVSAAEIDRKFPEKAVKMARMFTAAVFDLDGRMRGDVCFTNGGEYYGID